MQKMKFTRNMEENSSQKSCRNILIHSHGIMERLNRGIFQKVFLMSMKKQIFNYWLTKNLNCRRADMCWISRVIILRTWKIIFMARAVDLISHQGRSEERRVGEECALGVWSE